jgi:hypothetical protein
MWAHDWSLTDRITTKKFSRVAEEEKAKHCKKFQRLHKVQHPHFLLDNRKNVVNLSAVPLEETDLLASSKGLNYVMTPAIVPVEDILCEVEKSIGVPSEETAKEVRQATARFYNIPANQRQPVVERGTLRPLKALPADKGSENVVLDTADYSRNIAALLEGQAYRKLKKDWFSCVHPSALHH